MMRHLEFASLVVEAENVSISELMQIKLKAGLKSELTSSHTGKVAGYVIEGHMPVREVRRLLEEQPDATGLTVPGMPLGSPGMETNGPAEPYDVLLVRKDGTTQVYARYPRASLGSE